MLKKFSQHSGVVIPIDRAHVDTDALLPKQYLACIKKTGYGYWLFDDERYLEYGDVETDCTKRKINPDFILNQKQYANASIMISRENFGCGSSREHAVWALRDYGVRVVIAPSFASIFFDNCLKNNLLCIVIEDAQTDKMIKYYQQDAGSEMSVNLIDQFIELSDGSKIEFDIEKSHKEKLIHGLDDIGITLQHQDKIKNYEAQSRSLYPWLFDSFTSNK
ncbi:MAG: 3-isopropylmalate dehydratase small subunit [Gammaproteobacteria bacterium]|nr:3-isopropylmalate dehydratase small subunit [Gammaproteobacteria bacterium]MDH5629113.1 3-isopropylmalate dehydratase small subunit [Gammaproteobacteria bacterium]